VAAVIEGEGRWRRRAEEAGLVCVAIEVGRETRTPPRMKFGPL